MPLFGSPRHVTHTGWRGAALSAGTSSDHDWLSPVVELPFLASDLVPSWNVDTPPGCWVEVLLRGRCADGTWSPWFELGQWCADLPGEGGTIARTSVPGQVTAYGSVEVDELRAGELGGFASWQLRVRQHGSGALLRYAGAVASAGEWAPLRDDWRPAGSVLLDVPALSQQLHRGHFPQWDGGGASWCAATSLAMVVRHWGIGPSDAKLSWVGHAEDREVDHAARGTYDTAYGGCGNWAFGAAYAAALGASAQVTRLSSLTEAEALLRKGIPLIASVRHAAGELTGAGYETAGHLLVIVGLTADGDVVCNDPASHGIPDNAQVRVTYQRREFEQAWLGGSGGLVYVIEAGAVA